MGYYEKNENYVDNILTVAITVVTNPAGFWFDLFTSIPWSYFDMLAYRVRESPLARCFVKLRSPSRRPRLD